MLLLKNHIMREQSPISPMFPVTKPENCSYRRILNLKKLNEYVPYTHFHLQTIKSILTVINLNYFMAKIDIKYAYNYLLVDLEHQKY